MRARFGSLSATAFALKTKVVFSDEDIKWIDERISSKADFIDDHKLHIFDLPLIITCGSDIADELISRLRAYKFQKHFMVETKESGT